LSAPLVVLGPTASGKSDVAMALASDRSLALEILAVDAMQVYRGMDIGTAKPTVEERSLVDHHGIDLVDPDEDFTVTQYVAAATSALQEIADRGHRALLVAGTGLYLRALTDPMEIPGVWPELRAALEARAEAEGSAALHEELIALDPAAASKMEPSNARRVVRALEVCLGSGRPFSSYGPGLDQYPPVPFVMVGLRWERAALAARIEARVHRMMREGLLDEVRRILTRFPNLSRTARQALGYKELIDHLEGRCSLAEAVDQVILRTRQFAVRQERWFRRDPRIVWVDVRANPVAEVVPVMRELAQR
jgi:tRNA dimethylallyltransferase